MNHETARCVRLLVFVLFLGGAAPAQVTNIRIPDADATSGVTANLIPFGSEFGSPPGAWTHLTIVPANMLIARGAHAGDRLVDIQFAACGSGIVHMTDVQVIVGHLVSPLPTFCLADGFADQTLVYDSTASGPLDYPCTANTWCSLQVGGGNLAWNGVSDVGIYTTHTGLTISSPTGWQGSFWRASSLMRHYRNAYQATAALTSALSGLKIGLVFANPQTLAASLDFYGQGTPGSFGAPVMDPSQLPVFGNAGFGLGMVGAFGGATAILLVSSGQADDQIGAGADVRLLVDVSPAAAWFSVIVPLDAGGTAFFAAPVPNYTPAIAGLRVYCQWVVIGDPSGRPTVFGVPVALTPGVAVTIGV